MFGGPGFGHLVWAKGKVDVPLRVATFNVPLKGGQEIFFD